MKYLQIYNYVGSKEIRDRVDERFIGKTIIKIQDIMDWIEESDQIIKHESLIATFIINLNTDLVVADRHSEHVICAGGKKVLSAGEITFNFEKEGIEVSEISNQSTGYCPEPKSWNKVEFALNKIGIKHPGFFTKAYDFRYCENCGNKNLIKENIFECLICEQELDIKWNIYKMYGERINLK